MPIVVQHAPNANLLGNLSMQAGFGMYQQRQEQQDFERYMQQQALAQRQQEAAARQQLAQQQQQIESETRQRQQMLEAGRLQAGWQQNQQDNLFREKQLQGQNDWRAAQIQDDQAARKAAAENQAFGQQQKWNMDAAGDIEKIAEERRKEISQLQVTPQGQLLQGQLITTLRGIQKARTQMKPESYAAAMGKWLEEVERSGITDHVVKEPTPEEQLRKRTVPATDPVSGQPISGVWTLDAKGQPKFQDLAPKGAGKQQDPTVPLAHGQTSPATKAPTFGVPHDPAAMPSFEQWIANPKTFNEELKAARDALTVKPEPPSQANGMKGTKGHEPTLDEIEKHMREKFELQRKLAGGGGAKDGPAPQSTGLTLEQAQAEYNRMSNALNETLADKKLSPAERDAKAQQYAEATRKAGELVDQIQQGGAIPRDMPAPVQGPQIPAPPVPNSPFQQPAQAPQPAAPAIRPDFVSALDRVVKAVGSPDLINQDLIASEAHAADMRAQARGTPNGGATFITGIESDLNRLKAIKSKYQDGPTFLKNASSDEKREYNQLLEKVRPYLRKKQ